MASLKNVYILLLMMLMPMMVVREPPPPMMLGVFLLFSLRSADQHAAGEGGTADDAGSEAVVPPAGTADSAGSYS